MKIKLFSLAIILSIGVLFVGCNEGFPVSNDESPLQAKTMDTSELTPNAEVEPYDVVGCEVTGSMQQIPYWESDIQTVLTNCRVESLAEMGTGCTFVGTYTQTRNFDYQYPASAQYTAAQINYFIDNFASLADAYRPSANWMITGYSWTRDYGCTHMYFCYNLEITYRKIICNQSGGGSGIKLP